MNQDFKIIQTDGTKIGVGKQPMTGDTLIVIEDYAAKTWISLSKGQVNKLIENLLDNEQNNF